MYEYTHIYIHTHICICEYTHIYIYTETLPLLVTCIYAYTCIYVYTRIYIYTHICTLAGTRDTALNMCRYICVYTYLHMPAILLNNGRLCYGLPTRLIDLCFHVFSCVHIHMRICIYTDIHVYIYICIYIYLYIYMIHT